LTTIETSEASPKKQNPSLTYSRKKTSFRARDTGEQSEPKLDLVSAEQRYRRLYETTHDGIMARDLEGKTIDCNRAYANMLGYTKKELEKLSVKDLLPEKWLEQREKIVSKVIKTGRSVLFEREYTRKDGSIFPASVRTWRLTDGKGKVIGVWSIVRDITEQKQLQKDLENYAGVLSKLVEERTKQLKDTERLVAIGQTAGMVGHDLRNPLQTLVGELYLAKTEVDGLGDGEAKSNLKESIRLIEEQVAYMDKIVSDLQAFVQPVKIDKKPVDLKELITNVLATVPIPNNISVKTECQDVFPAVKADPQLLKRVLINLVTNAVQAMPNGGNLNLTLQVNSPDQVSVSVKDTGVGIADKIKGQIFAPLFTTKPRGQGFGLAVCKRVIEAHGGTISFESTEGNGATFTIEFPAN
jgi:two-component system sensor kinase FixL